MVQLKRVGSFQQQLHAESTNRSQEHSSINLAQSFYQQARLAVQQGEFQEAIPYYQKTLGHSPKHLIACQELGNVFLKLQRWKEAITTYNQALQLQPKLPQVYHNLGEAYSQLEQWLEAIASYRQAIQLNPDYSWSHNNLADILLKQEQWQEAIASYRQAIQLNPDFSWSHHNLGKAYVMLQQWEEAITACQRAIELNSESCWSYYNLAEAFFHRQKWEEAVKAYHQALQLQSDLPQAEERLNYARHQNVKEKLELAQSCYSKAIEQEPDNIELYHKAIKLQPMSSELYMGLGKAWQNHGEFNQAIIAYEKAIQLNPNWAEVYGRYSEVLTIVGREIEALEARFKGLTLEPNWATPEGHLSLGNQLQEIGKLEPAKICYQRVLKFNPDVIEAYSNLGKVLTQQHKWALAIESYQEGIKRFPDNRECLEGLEKIKTEQRKWNQTASADLENQSIQHELTILSNNSGIESGQLNSIQRQEIDLKIKRVEGLIQQGDAFRAQEQWEEARSCYQQAIEIDPNNGFAYHQLGDYWLTQDQFENAVELYQSAIQLNPEFCWSYCNLGRTLQKMNRLEEAINIIQEAIEIEPGFAWNYYYLGDILFQDKNWDEAMNSYQKAAALDPNLPDIQEKLGDVFLQKSYGLSKQAFQFYQKAIDNNSNPSHLYQKALEIKPLEPEIYVQFCKTLIQRNQIEQAIIFYQMGLKAMIDESDIDSPFDFMELGNHCAKQGKLQEAIFFYQEGINIEPENNLLAWQLQNTQAMKDREFAYPVEWVDHLHLRQPQPLTLTPSEQPIVSIIIPVYNEILHTYNCLRSLAETLDETLPYEVIVIDDHSQDNTQAVLAQIQGVQYYINEENLGFIDACNRGASLAKGKYLFFLNNDTVVMPNCLQELLETFRLFPKAGLVGAQFLYPNGQLQEAGGIIWQDGSGWNYGRCNHPNQPEYCYLREVDYCSGAGIMIPTALWNQLGGFDLRFKPAYYEDTDLAFEVRKAGYKVFYQPLAKVIHFEGISSGTDLTQGMKRYQVVNHQKFLDKWQNVLQQHRPNGIEPNLERERAVKKRLLMIDARILMPDKDSGSLTAFNLIKIFQSLDYKVTFAPDNLLYVNRYTEDLQRIGVECLYCSHVTSIQSYLETHGKLYDVIYLARLEVTEKYIHLVKTLAPQAQVIYDTVDLHYLREIRKAKLKDSLSLYEKAIETKQREIALMEKADCTLVVSRLEQQLLQEEYPALQNIEFFHMPREIYGSAQGFEPRHNILFIGGFEHPPNIDAVLYFVEEIFPKVKAEINEMKFFVIGSKAPPEILNLASEDIIITGYVPDISDYFNQCKLSVAPLRYGAGIKGKILTSFSYGLPVVATSIAAEGMELQNSHDVLIEDNAEQFAQQVVRLYTDSDLWETLSHNSLETLSTRYSTEAVTQKFEGLLRNLSVVEPGAKGMNQS